MEGTNNHSQPTSNKTPGKYRTYTSTASYGDTTSHEQPTIPAYLDPRSSSRHLSPNDSSHSRVRTSGSPSQAAGGRGYEYTSLRSSEATTLLSDVTLAAQGQSTDSSRVETMHPASHERLSSESQFESYPNTTNNTPNIIIFGETGIRKSSLINMIVGTESAAVSNAAIGCTFEAFPHDVELSSRKYRLWDTAGLNEGEKGNVSADRAMESLQKLVHNLRDGGVSLLVYCIRGLRIRDIVKINYDLFHKIICGEHVPIVVVVTGLENEENMEDWWIDNAEDFHRRRIQFSGHACITTTRGKVTKNGQHMFEEEYNQSAKLVRELVIAHCPERSWKPDGSIWLVNIVEKMRQMYDQSDHWGRDYAQSVDSPVNSMTSRYRPVSPRTEPPLAYGARNIIQQLIDFFFLSHRR